MSRPLFRPSEVVSSTRLRLSACDAGFVSVLPWLATALAPEWSLEELESSLRQNPGVLIADSVGVDLGLAVVLLEKPMPGAASVPFLAIDPARRFRGLGGEAGLLLERHVRERLTITRFYAPVPDGRGLAVYFWLRLGYRPLLQSESPGPLLGLTSTTPAGIWLLRDTE